MRARSSRDSPSSTEAIVRYLPTGSRILDFGCGPGVLAVHLKKKGFDVSGTDIAPKMIAQAVSAAKAEQVDVGFRVGGIGQLESAQGTYDAIVASSVMEYLPDVLRALRVFRERIVGGGHLIFTIPNRQCWLRRGERLARVFAGVGRWIPWPHRLRRYSQYLRASRNHYTLKEICRLGDASGFVLIEHKYLKKEAPSYRAHADIACPMLLLVLRREKAGE